MNRMSLVIIMISLAFQATAVTTPGAAALKESLVADFWVFSEKPYEWSFFSENHAMYIDRDYTYTSVPETLRGKLILIPSNFDKYYDAVDTIIRFKVKKRVRIYIIYSGQYTHLEEIWLNQRRGWQEEKMEIQTSLAPHKAIRRVKSKIFTAGAEVKLGGNGCVLRNCDMYSLVIVPLGPSPSG